MRTDEQALVDRLRDLAARADRDQIRTAMDGVHEQDIAEAIMRLEHEESLVLLQKLDAETAAYVLIELPTEDARAIINELPDATVAHYLDILPMDDAIELREELDPERFEALLNVIPVEDADEIRRLMSYPEGSAGQLLTEDYVEVGATATMSDVLAIIRQTTDADFETVNYIYVIGEDRHLLGVLTLRRVIRAEPGALARDVMNSDPISVSVNLPEVEVARTLARYSFSAIPVLDDRGRMLGIVTADDAQEVLEEAQTENVLKMGAVSGDAEAYLSLSIFELVKRRLPWIMILFIAEFFTGSVLRYYLGNKADGNPNETLAILAKLQLFVPLLIGAGGNSGSQVTTTITRALALGEVKTRDWFLVIKREVVVGGVIGISLGLIGFIRAYFPIIGWSQPLSLSLVIALALPAIIIWAGSVGSLLPIAAKKLGIDPAVMSAPFISTFVDATGLIIYFEIARVILAAFGVGFK